MPRIFLLNSCLNSGLGIIAAPQGKPCILKVLVGDIKVMELLAAYSLVWAK